MLDEKKKQLEKLSINLKPEINSLLRELIKREKIPLRQLLASTIELLIFSFYLEVIFFKERRCGTKLLTCFLSKRVLIIWFNSKVEVLI